LKRSRREQNAALIHVRKILLGTCAHDFHPYLDSVKRKTLLFAFIMISLPFRLRVLLIGVTCVLVLCSCSVPLNFGPSVSNLTVTDAYNASYQPHDIISTFYVDSPQICCTAQAIGIQRSTEVKVNWLYVNGIKSQEEKPLIHADKISCDRNCNLGFTLYSPPGGFVTGEYRVEIEIGGQIKAKSTFNIELDKSASPPVIKTFEADTDKIIAGQPSVLSWKVSNATRINIVPGTGNFGSEGKLTVNPVESTTYILWALNRSGSSSDTIMVDVTQPVTGKADLTVTEFWSTGNVLFYRVRNIGNIASTGTESFLYKGDLQVSKDYVAPLDPGAERVESFAQYHFSPRFTITSSGLKEGTSDAVTMRVCVNGNGACVENNNSNNSMEINFGMLMSINLAHYAYIAKWRSSAGDLTWPTLKGNTKGTVMISTAQMDGSGNYSGSLLMTPPSTKDSWMEGQFGLLDKSTSALMPFTIPHKCKLTTKIGITIDSSSTKVTFKLGTVQGSEITYFTPVNITEKGKLESYEIDLSQLAGKQLQFVLRVESESPLSPGSAVWVDPYLIQER
jgi:hypothetical protein